MSMLDLVGAARDRIRPPVCIVLGTARDVGDLCTALPDLDIVCYQMDAYLAERIEDELTEFGLGARVVARADLWDLSAEFQTVLYPMPKGGERILKVDMVEQAFHILAPQGKLILLSPYQSDLLVPDLVKKIFGRVHMQPAGKETVFWGVRQRERPRRRHEVTFQARIGDEPPLRFVSRPGVFAYGRFDDGARALVETMTVEPGDRILDLGCGCGTNGIFAARRSGPEGSVTFVDSNLRAVALAELNARANGVASFRTVASSRLEGLPEGDFDVILANPPYFAYTSIAQLFVEGARRLLRPGGRFYLVTKQPTQVEELVAETFGEAEVVLQRGYTIFCAEAPAEPRPPASSRNAGR